MSFVMCSVTVCLSRTSGWEFTYNLGNVCVVSLLVLRALYLYLKTLCSFHEIAATMAKKLVGIWSHDLL